jgi:hypothetical protein
VQPEPVPEPAERTVIEVQPAPSTTTIDGHGALGLLGKWLIEFVLRISAAPVLVVGAVAGRTLARRVGPALSARSRGVGAPAEGTAGSAMRTAQRIFPAPPLRVTGHERG